MTQVTFITAESQHYDLDGVDGESLMQLATSNLIPGIIGECGGSCACATCHVYVDEAWAGRLAPVTSMERDLLTMVTEPKPSSRLSCQIDLTPALAGIVLYIPVPSY